MSRLSLDADQAELDSWLADQQALVSEGELFQVDVEDAKLVFITARYLAKEMPEKLPLLREHAPEAVERASRELGIFMGVTWLAERCGIDPAHARDAVGIAAGWTT